MRGLRLVLALALASVEASSQWSSPNARPTYTQWVTQLRSHLLADYDKGAPPTSIRTAKYSGAGTDVKMQLRMFKVLGVSATEGQMTLKVWWRMWWNDTRLEWNPADFGGIDKVRFNIASFQSEEAEIWSPDIQAYNALDGMDSSFDGALAEVSSSGEVKWSRPGTLQVMCRLSGLAMFPYDQLSCPLEIGGWMMGGEVQGLTSHESGCVSLAATEEVSLASYQEMNFQRVECSEHTYIYPTLPSDPFPVLKYRIYVSRASSYYSLSLLIPTALITLISFAVFYMSFEVGERLGVGVTMVLTIEINRAGLQTMLPVCGELLWLQVFFLLHEIYCFISLFESCVVLGLSFCNEPTLMPTNLISFFHETAVALGMRSAPQIAPKTADSSGGEGEADSAAGRMLRGLRRDRGAFLRKRKKRLEAGSPTPDSKPAVEPLADGPPPFAPPPLAPPSPPAADDEVESLGAGATPMWGNVAAEPIGASAASAAADGPEASADTKDDATKLIFFENLFFNLDGDGDDHITFEDVRRLLAFTALTLTAEEREKALRDADAGRIDGKLDRYEFMDLCVTVLWDVELGELEAAASSYTELQEHLKHRINARWRIVADEIDRVCRFWVPVTYLFFLMWLFCTTLEDNYRQIKPGYSGDASNEEGTNLQVVDYRELADTPTSKYFFMADWLLNIDMGLGVPSAAETVVLVFVVLSVLMYVALSLRKYKARRKIVQQAREQIQAVNTYEKAIERRQQTMGKLLTKVDNGAAPAASRGRMSAPADDEDGTTS